MANYMKTTKLSTYKRKTNIIYFLFALPGVVYLIINNFIPMVMGFIISFKNVNFSVGILKSEWNNFENFKYLFQTSDAWIITRNTILYNLAIIFLSTIVAVLIALLLNEVKNKYFFKYYQGIILFPHLISMLIVSYLVYAFLSSQTGFVNNTILEFLGISPISWYNEPKYWPFILTYVGCWKNFGFQSLIFYAAIANIDPEIYEAAETDGASRLYQAIKITMPLIKSTIAIMILLNIGKIFSSDFGLFYQVPMDSGALYSTTNVIDTYVYRALLESGNISMASAACLYQSVVGCLVFCCANLAVKAFSPDDALF